MIIEHNMPAFNANRINRKNNKKLSKSLEKLSSGYAINRAGDNAAGLAVSEKMRSQIAGMTQAVKNCQDGISLVQTFEGALGEIHTIIKRCKTLADQCANGSYDDPIDRTACQQEYIQLCDEVNHMADTDFNGILMLNAGRMADKFTVFGENNHVHWLCPETISYDRDSYVKNINTTAEYDMKIELMPGVAEAPIDKKTFEMLVDLDRSGVKAIINKSIATFFFKGKAPAGIRIETDRNVGIIKFEPPRCGITEIAKVSVPQPVHNAHSVATGAWKTYDDAPAGPAGIITAAVYDNGSGGTVPLTSRGSNETERQNYVSAMTSLLSGHTFNIGADPANKPAEYTSGPLTLSIDYNAGSIKPDSSVTITSMAKPDNEMHIARSFTGSGRSYTTQLMSTPM